LKLIISSVSGEPIYEQIKNQIRSAIMSGELMAGGEALPSLRKLAKELRVSVLTVTRAYNELADEGLVENVQGKGTFVMERGNELMRERARERIMDKLREVSIEAKAADISLLDLLGMFEKAYREQS
jgi:GntR family transcriptional regulator